MRSLPVAPELTLNPASVRADGEADGNMFIKERLFLATDDGAPGEFTVLERLVGEHNIANVEPLEMEEGADGPMFADNSYQPGADVKAPEQQKQPRISDLSTNMATVQWSALYLRDAPLIASQLVVELGESSALIEVPADAGPTTELVLDGSNLPGLGVEVLWANTSGSAPTFRLHLSGLTADSAYTVSSRVSTRGGWSPLSEPSPMATSPEREERGGDDFLIWLIPVVVVILLAAVVLSHRRLRRNEVFLLRETRKPPTLVLNAGEKWHTFVSHTWKSGQDQASVIKRQLGHYVPGMRVFLDVDDLDDISKLEAYIEQTNTVIFFMSRGYFKSANCLREMRATMAQSKPVVLVHEADEGKGGEPLESMMSQCPMELRGFIFGNSSSATTPPREIIRWHRVTPFQISSLLRIAAGVVQAGPNSALSVHPSDSTTPANEMSMGIDKEPTAKELSGKRGVTNKSARTSKARLGGLYLPSAVTEERITLAESIIVYVSPNNPGAMARVTELCPADSAVCVTADAASLEPGTPGKKATHMCLYLNASTFVASDDNPYVGEHLAAEVKAARESGISMLMLHENDPTRGGCAFEQFFYSTPDQAAKTAPTLFTPNRAFPKTLTSLEPCLLLLPQASHWHCDLD